MTLTVTSVIAGFCLALAVLFGWLGARKAKPMAKPRLVPWQFMMMLAFVGLLAMLAHLVTLLGGGQST